MRPKLALEGLPGGVWAAWGPFGPLRSWAPIGALRAPLGAALGPLLGPPGARLGLIWASRGASVEGSLAKSRKPRNSLTVQHFLKFFEVSGAPESLQHRSQARLGASGGLLGPRGAVWSLSGPLRGPSAWLLGPPWVAPDRSERTATRGPYITPSPKTV